MSAEACDYQQLDHCVQLIGYNAAEAENQYWMYVSILAQLPFL